MALDDTLFQVDGQTVQREDHTHIGDDRKDYFCEEDGVVFAGKHLLIDVVNGHRLDDLDHMDAMLREAVEACGATLLHIHIHHFTPNGGISGVAVLAESHISVHTWPEANFAAFDVFMCGDTVPERAVPVIERYFTPERIDVSTERRGANARLRELSAT